MSSYDATQLCNENILANQPQFITNLILQQASAPSYHTGPDLKIPLTSQRNAFWKILPDQPIRFNLEHISEDPFWITGVAINEIPEFDATLQLDCDLNPNELDTQFYAISTFGDEGTFDLESVYTEGQNYSFKPVAEGVDVSVKIAVNPVVASGIEVRNIVFTLDAEICQILIVCLLLDHETKQQQQQQQQQHCSSTMCPHRSIRVSSG